MITRTPPKATESYKTSYFEIFSFKIKNAKNVAHIGNVKKMQLLVDTGMYLTDAIFPNIPTKPMNALNIRIFLYYFGISITLSPNHLAKKYVMAIIMRDCQYNIS